MDRVGPVLRQFGTTDEELDELEAMLGPLEHMRPDALVQAIALLKIQNLEKRIAELEPKKCEHQFEDTRAFWDYDGAKEVTKKYCRKCGVAQ